MKDPWELQISFGFQRISRPLLRTVLTQEWKFRPPREIGSHTDFYSGPSIPDLNPGILRRIIELDDTDSTIGSTFCFRRNEKGDERSSSSFLKEGLDVTNLNPLSTTFVKEPKGSTTERFSIRGVQRTETRVMSWSSLKVLNVWSNTVC